ncbi:restriction endonuclease [Solwaraspora sp. WMMA2065]|uniref:McrC family protein n=1 Tax=Solwaraspora sp. WMMA2065 TaxID=3015166 RepID=UPI00259BBF7E|nr:restriction endonuclease [Solwaraspora sp. WMMA2065]WJK33061.1 restriction endonuclease [Solwaraspora sp. WMMA2065]
MSSKEVVLSLGDAQVAALRAAELVTVRRADGGRWKIKAGRKVGAIRVGDLEIEVTPKVGLANMIFFLGYATSPGFRPEDVAGIPVTGLWPALATSLIRQARRALAPGPLRGYVTVDDALPLIRGRIRFTDQLAGRPGMPLPIEVQYDDHTPNFPENQILRAAIRRMLAVPRLRPVDRDDLTELDARLTGVTALPTGTPPPVWHAGRLNAHYAPALRLSELILLNSSADPGTGVHTIAAFVVNMEKVFEAFIGTALRDALSAYPGHTETPGKDTLDPGRAIRIEPDVLHLIDGRPAAVFDAKYKIEPGTGRPTNPDLYQMLAYCTALNLRTGWIIYAEGADPPTTWHVRNTDIQIGYQPLNLRQPPDQLLKDVQAFAHSAIHQTVPAYLYHP